MSKLFTQFFLLVVLSNICCSCGNSDEVDIIVPSDEREISERIDLKNFTSICVDNGFKVILHEDVIEQVVVDAPVNLQPYIETVIIDSRLEVRRKENIAFSGTPDIIVYVTYKKLSSLSGNRFSKIYSYTPIRASDFSILLSYGSNVDLDIYCKNLCLTAGQSSSIYISGEAETFKVNLTEKVVAETFGLTVKKLEACLLLNSLLDATVEESISIEASDKSVLTYQGTPTIVKQVLANGATLVKK